MDHTAHNVPRQHRTFARETPPLPDERVTRDIVPEVVAQKVLAQNKRDAKPCRSLRSSLPCA